MQQLGGSWDVVEVVRSLVTEVVNLQMIAARQEARLQVLEGKQVIGVSERFGGDLVAESEGVGVPTVTGKSVRAAPK